ncbi:hypothetical protein [Synechococcus sp. UW179A]|nr:hypothetical protein [Synechococcus sp. UW179A]
MLRDGLERLCNGERRASDHKLEKAVAEALQTLEAALKKMLDYSAFVY